MQVYISVTINNVSTIYKHKYSYIQRYIGSYRQSFRNKPDYQSPYQHSNLNIAHYDIQLVFIDYYLGLKGVPG